MIYYYRLKKNKESRQLCFEDVRGVASAHNPEKRFHPKFDGKNWVCECDHFKRFKTPCRHILEKKLERERWQPRVFNGPSYEPALDEKRLKGQMLRIVKLMIDGEWRTLNEINEDTGDPPASISAQLRHLRKKRFGGNIVDKRRRDDDTRGLWEYHLSLT